MANNGNSRWHRGNGSPVPQWFKEHIEWLRNNLEEEKEIKRDIFELTKLAFRLAADHDIDVKLIKKKLKMA